MDSGGFEMNLERLIYWLEQIKDEKEPKIPYNLHKLVRCLCNNMGTEEAILRLKQLNKMKGDEE